MTAGQAVVWYQGQFQALFFLQNTLQIPFKRRIPDHRRRHRSGDAVLRRLRRLSDRIGSKKIILGGCLLAAITYVPIYLAMNSFAGPARPVDAAGKAITVHLTPNILAEVGAGVHPGAAT